MNSTNILLVARKTLSIAEKHKKTNSFKAHNITISSNWPSICEMKTLHFPNKIFDVKYITPFTNVNKFRWMKLRSIHFIKELSENFNISSRWFKIVKYKHKNTTYRSYGRPEKGRFDNSCDLQELWQFVILRFGSYSSVSSVAALSIYFYRTIRGLRVFEWQLTSRVLKGKQTIFLITWNLFKGVGIEALGREWTGIEEGFNQNPKKRRHW